MALTIELWEDSGAATGSPQRGTTIQEVDNLGWKDSSLDETYPFADYPIGRPYGSTLYSTSYKKYYFYKIYGTYTETDPPTIKFDGTPIGDGSPIGEAENLVMTYKWSNVYETPNKTLLSGIIYDPTIPPIWTPLLSITGPNASDFTEVTSLVNDTTYYTPYLVTQLIIYPSTEDDYGNLHASFSLQFDLNEKKTGLPGFDATLINWSP